MKTILVPVDFSSFSKHALDLAIELNELIKGRIVLMHVFDAPIVKEGMLDQKTLDDLQIFFKETLVGQVDKKLAEWASILDEKKCNHVKKVLHGNPYEQITQQIVKEKADLIIMGSKGVSGLKGVFVGSNAERVIRHASCPVLVVKEQTKLNEFRNVTLATEGSQEADRFANDINGILNLLNLKVHLVKIRTFKFETEEEDLDILHKFAQRNGIVNYTLNSFLASAPDVGVIEFAKQIRSGLIIVITHGRKGIQHIVGGSWSENIVNDSKIPILSLNLSGTDENQSAE